MPAGPVWLVPIALLGACVTPLLGQSDERQQPFDSAGRVVVLTPQLATRLGLDSILPGAAGYRVARLYRRADSTYVVEFVFGTGPLEHRTRYDVPTQLVARLREATRDTHVAAQVERRFQEGRAALLRSSVALGLGFYGWAVPAVLDVNDPRGAGSLFFLTSGASFFVPFLATRTSDVTRATASLYWYGATRGIGVGLLTSDLIDPQASGRTTLGFALVGSVLGSAVGVMYGRGGRLSHGEAAAATTYGDLGAIAGINLALTSGLYGDATRSERGGHALVLGGLGAGLVLGPAIARREAYGEGDPSVVLNGALLGMGAAATFLVATDAQNDHVVGGTLIAGEVVGAIAGNLLARRVSLTEGQGTITSLAMLGGALLGAGLVYIAGGTDADPATYIGAATAGGTAAMLLVLGSYRDRTRTSFNSGRGDPTLTIGPGFVQLRF